MKYNRTVSELERILGIIEQLRSPGGCPWDLRQTREDVGNYLLNETCEVLDAVDEGSPEHLKEELGDLLFLVFFMARMAEEEGCYDSADIMAGVSDKMIRRHPHVFGDARADTAGDVRKNWEAIKRREKGDRGEGAPSPVPDVPRSLPPLNRAYSMGEAAAQVGFDWDGADGVIEKIREELAELEDARQRRDVRRIEEELGDLLFSMANLCRHEGVHPDRALRGALRKFIRRFAFMEKRLADEGKSLESATADEMNRCWELSKEIGKLEDRP